MTDDTQSKTDDEDEQNRELKAWLKAALIAYLARAKSAVAQSVDEIAPQVRGAFGRLHVPPGAIKPLALAAVLILAAVAFPAAPFAGDAMTNGSEPVQGETYEAVGGDDLREVVTDRLEAATTSAPAPPSDVRTSAGSQTMRVETSVVDGDPAIVLEDDRTHDGRWVAIDTAWFQEELGEVPQTARIAHESDRTYSTPIEVRGDEAAFYVEGFSTNTVTFDGTLSVSASPAVDGDTISYDAPNGGDDLSIDLTGVDNTAPASTSTSASDGDTIEFDVGGTDSPRDESVTLIGVEETSSGSLSPGTVSDGYSTTVDVAGNQPAEDATVTLTGEGSTTQQSKSGSVDGGSDSFTVSPSGNVAPAGPDGNGEPHAVINNGVESDITLGFRGEDVSGGGMDSIDLESWSITTVDGKTYGSDTTQEIDEGQTTWNVSNTGEIDTLSVDVFIAAGGSSGESGKYELYFSNGDVGSDVFSDGDQILSNIEYETYGTTNTHTFGSDDVPVTTSDATVNLDTGGNSVTLTGGSDTKSIPLSTGSQTVNFDSTGRADVSIEWTDRTRTEDPSVTIGGSTVSHAGILSPGSTTTKSLSLSPGASQSVDVSTSGDVGVEASWTEVTATEDPSVTVGDSTVSHTGILGPGETVSESVDLSTGSQSADVSVNGPVDVEASWTEVSKTRDPVVEYNGQTASYDGTLSEGETTSLAVNDSWINEGANDLSVSLGSVSSGPQPQVGVDVTHDIQESRTIDYSAEAFSERYTTSKTWSENTSNATLTVPWASSSVVAVRDVSVTYEDSTGSEPSPRPSPTHRLENGSVVVDLGDVEAGWSTEISATGSKVQVDGADLEVVNATAAGEDLDSRIRLNNPSEDTYIRVGETDQGQQLHYLANASWSNEEASQISADGTNEIRIPNAPDNGEAQLRTLPLAFDVDSGAIDVDIPDERVNHEEPVYRVSPGDSTGDSYDVTYTEASDGQPYVLYDESNDIVLDQGMASSPLTLSATEPEDAHVIQFREDDGSASSSGTGSGPVGAIGPMVTTSSPFSGLTGVLPGPNVFLIGLAGLAGLGIVARQTRLFNEGTTSDAIADSAASVGERAGELLGRALSNQLVLAALTLSGGVWLLTSGAFTPTERLIISIGTVPVAMFLVLQQFDQFDIRVWAGSTAVIGVLGIQAIAPEVFTTIAEEAGIVIVAGGLILGWRALSAWRAEASTPDSVTNLEVQTTEDDDGN